MGIVAFKFEILKFELEDIGDFLIDFHLRERSWFARQLQTRLIEMIQIQVRIT